jgi:hypothetical protein
VKARGQSEHPARRGLPGERPAGAVTAHLCRALRDRKTWSRHRAPARAQLGARQPLRLGTRIAAIVFKDSSALRELVIIWRGFAKRHRRIFAYTAYTIRPKRLRCPDFLRVGAVPVLPTCPYTAYIAHGRQGDIAAAIFGAACSVCR